MDENIVSRLALTEISEQDLNELLGQRGWRGAVLFVTPWCGTCQLAERMMAAVQATGTSLPVFKLNINYTPAYRESWRLASVPCVVLIEGGNAVQIEYRLNGADYLFRLIKEFECAHSEE